MADRSKKFGGLTFRIDRPKGYVKEWPQAGWTKRFTYPVDYGYLPRHTGEDGEGLDFFVGDDPGGHLESFQKLKRDEHGRRLLDETKFLVGVTDAERETIYRLYGDEVWHRKVYKDMAALVDDLPKFKAGKKPRYTEKKASMTPQLYGVLVEKRAINFGRVGSALQGVVQRFQGPQHVPTMLPPIKKPDWHGNLHAEMVKHYLANQHQPGASQVGLMTERARQLGYHDVGSAQSLGEMTDRLSRLGISPSKQLAETSHFSGAPQTRAQERAFARGLPDSMLGRGSLQQHLEQNAPTMPAGYTPTMPAGYTPTRPAITPPPPLPKRAADAAVAYAVRRAKIAVLARYGFKEADAKFADIDKRVTGEIEVTGPNPADWAFSRLTGPQLIAGAETSSTPGARG